jgi:hypothetical protein
MDNHPIQWTTTHSEWTTPPSEWTTSHSEWTTNHAEWTTTRFKRRVSFISEQKRALNSALLIFIVRHNALQKVIEYER